ncbi:MAG TPA: arginine--tRNA ligase [Gaiellaceae bacterium]|nr:arginine--tRNA ligase [Gaiellaceae bacterium]
MPEHAVSRLAAEVSELAGAPVELERPSDPSHGDFATNAALRLAGAQRRPPREFAAELAERAERLEHVASAEVAGPGFVNLRVATSWYTEALREVLEAGSDYGAGSAAHRERIQVEMVSANPTGPITVASARNGAYGDAVARLLAFAGHEVQREYYVNDVGRQIELFRQSVDARRRGEEPPEDGYRGAYVHELARTDGDPLPRMLRQIEETLTRFRIRFDSWERQSRVEDDVREALAALPTYESEGATWVRTSDYGDDKDRVAIRSDGEPTYFASDCAYLRRKLARFDRAVYVLGADHHGYVARLRAIAEALGEDPGRVEVLIYQLVQLTKGGERTKMAKRSGDVVFLDELLDEVGVDAARWYLVNRGPDQPIEIDVDLAAEKSQKNPVYYVQYAHARVAGILRNASDAAIGGDPPKELATEEKELVKRVAEFPGIAAEAAVRRGPQAIPTYAIRLADDFHRFYHEHRVLESDAQAFRLGLCRATQLVIARCLDLVGVEAPERM